MTEFVDPQGDPMVPLRCELCGVQVGLKSPGVDEKTDPLLVVRCFGCAAVEEAEAITKGSMT